MTPKTPMTPAATVSAAARGIDHGVKARALHTFGHATTGATDA